MKSSVFDVIIAGAGPAGLSAALWADELGLSFALLESKKAAGGQLLITYNRINNHLGFDALNGNDLRDTFVKQLDDRNIPIELSSSVARLDLKNRSAITDDGSKLSFRYFLLCTGVRRRLLGIPGESEFKDKGILASGKRDKDQSVGKTAVVVGGGDAAFENALILAECAGKVILIHRRSEFSARAEFVSRVIAHPSIEILTDTIMTAVEGNRSVERVKLLKNGHSEVTEKAEIVVVRIGVAPNSELVADLVELDKNRFVRVDSNGQTKNPSIFAAGDVANPVSLTVSTAVGTGATAIKAIRDLL